MRIGLILNVLDEEYQISVFKGVRNRAEKLGVELICFQLENEDLSVDSPGGIFSPENFFNLDGVVLLTSSLAENLESKTKADIERLWNNIPIVSVGQKIDGIPSLLIQSDNAMRSLVSHLVKVHHYKNFVYLVGPKNHQDAINRETVFVNTLEAFKKDKPQINYTIRNGSFNEIAAHRVMSEYYEENPKANPDVIVCANDNMAIGVYKFFKMYRHLKHIKPCAVTGFDDIPQAKYELPPLTTVRQSVKNLGSKSVDTILDLISGKSTEEEFFLDAEVIIRNSCGCTSVTDVDSEKNHLLEKFQEKYVRSERMLKLVSQVDQNFSNAENYSDLMRVTNVNMEQLGVKNYCILRFKDTSVEPVYVRRNKLVLDNSVFGNNIPIGEFYEKYIHYDANEPKSLVFKYLRIGGEIFGGVFYDSPDENLPYLCTVAVSVAQSLSWISLLADRERRSVYLEKEVENRTRELFAANSRRMEVEAEVLEISELERQRFSQDLHDDICQRLAGISMLCRSYSNKQTAVEKSEMEELASLISDTLQRTRQYAHNSYPVELDGLGMNHSINNLCNSFELQTGIHCDYSWEVPESIPFNKTQKLNIFRIIQEALHNVGKHSGADKVLVSLSITEEKPSEKNLYVVISDNGCGLPKGTDGKLTEGLGLNSMQYRANQIDADFSIGENSDGGACVEIKMKI